METQLQQHGQGNGIAFLFGVIVQMIASLNFTPTWEFVLHSLFGGLVCLFFKLLGDLLSPLLQRGVRWLLHACYRAILFIRNVVWPWK
jgi:hypothetical protein